MASAREPWPYLPFGHDDWLTGADPSDPALAAVRVALEGSLATSPPEVPERVEDADVTRLRQAAARLAELAERSDWALLAVVGELRSRGCSWEDVARALGVSKQAAHRRFAAVVAEAQARARR